SDGWSMDVLLRDLSLLYNAYEAGEESPLPELPIQYADFAVWQRDYLQGEVLEDQLSYWKERLRGAPATIELPTDRPRPSRRSNKGAAYTFTIPADLSEQLKQFSNGEGMTLYTTLLTGFMMLLSRWSGEDDVVVGTPIAGRTRTEVENLIGFFVNVLPVRVDISGGLSFRQLLERVRKTSLEAYSYQDVPFEMVVKELQPERNLSHSPIYQIIFQFQNAGEALSLTNLQTSVRRHRSESSKMDLAFSLTAKEGGIGGSVEYSTELFDVGTIRRMVAQFQMLLRGAIAEPNRAVRRLALLSDEGLQQVVQEWNETRSESDATRWLHERFEEQARQTPDAIAVVSREGKLTYEEVNERANRVAHWLIAQGIGPESVVGILLDRCPALVVSVLAVLKAGAAYLPLDPQQPGDRLSFMLEDAGAPVLLTKAELLDSLPVYWGQTLCLDQESETEAFSVKNPVVTVTGENLAYVIYTSGSTGQPKGVMISHQAVSNYVSWAQAAYGFQAGQGAPVHSSVGFDLTVTSIYTPLVSGGWVKLLGEGDGSLGAVNELREALASKSAYGLVKLTPAHLEVLRRSLNGDDVRQASPCFVVGGEQLRSETAQWWRQRAPQIRIYNEYGPTEATVGCCVQEFSQDENNGKDTVAIGRPIANTRLYVLDSEGEPVGAGMTGELYIGGLGVARGYLGRADLTADRFVPDAFSGIAGERLYRSGDLARYRANGVLECLGRIDQQVKLRGYRVELGEIETALRALAEVRDSIVLVQETDAGDKRLIAYVTRDQQKQLTTNDLRNYLRDKLPEYMVPNQFAVLDEFPLTANGKV
ncbi:MAG TPA: amino acid adenylation domain-containing protein, partial [Pyrinomonadaceae bacterium]|nr:amino acid adenylation domain-containing protein [Pyrinomonadaceae bacterium]